MSQLRAPFLSAANEEPKPTRRRRDAPTSIRFSKSERRELERAANGAPIATYVKSRLFGSPLPRHRTRGQNPVKDFEALGRVLGLLGQSRIASNLNQLARAANLGALSIPPEAAAELNEACRAVIQMRRELLGALGLEKDVER